MLEWGWFCYTAFKLFTIICCVLGTVWFCGWYLLKENAVYIHESRRRHEWKSIKILNRACFCSVCEILIPSNGVFCECCGICSDTRCIKKAEKSIKCKEKIIKDSEPAIKHSWVKGNLPLGSECFVCHAEIDYHGEPGLYGFRCCWCQITIHSCCKIIFEDECNFGEVHDMIIPPNSIVASRSRGAPKLHVTSLKLPDWPNWKPIIVIANVKSGSSSCAEKMVSLLRGILHPLQVQELSIHGPEDALQWALKISPKQCRILVAGGDGTVGWILNTIFKMNIHPIPEVGILPLGTGNDLSRVLGWGAEPPSTITPIDMLKNIKNAKPIELDRWLLEINNLPFSKRLNLLKKLTPNLVTRSLFMYNYFSVGVDAQVTLNFHKARESRLLYMFRNRIMNKLLYLFYGTQQVFQPECSGLEKYIILYLDDVKIELPELQSIVCLNIDSWGAGVTLWKMSETSAEQERINKMEELHSISDGILEVFGIVSSFHIAQLQVGLNKPIRLGQAKTVRIIMKSAFPVQADGEPWIQTPCEINLKQSGQAIMLKNPIN